MKVSIVIPVLNRWDLAERCVQTIKVNTGTVELVTVANGPSYAVSSAYRGVPAVVLDRNRGFAVGCNIGAHYASGDVLVFLNDDTEVHEGWLPPLLDALNDGALIAGSKLVFPDGRIQHSGIDVDMSRYGREARNWTHDWAGGPVDAVTGACLAIGRATFMDAGGFDEGFWNGYEDVDLCLRVGSCRYVPESVVTHLESQSGPERWTRVRQNIDRLQQKWGT